MKEMEANAILEGIRLVVEKGWQNIVVESNAEMVINHLKGGAFIRRIEAILSAARALATSLRRVLWVAIPRTVNKCADCVAKSAQLRVFFYDWVSRPYLTFVVSLY